MGINDPITCSISRDESGPVSHFADEQTALSPFIDQFFAIQYVAFYEVAKHAARAKYGDLKQQPPLLQFAAEIRNSVSHSGMFSKNPSGQWRHLLLTEAHSGAKALGETGLHAADIFLLMTDVAFHFHQLGMRAPSGTGLTGHEDSRWSIHSFREGRNIDKQRRVFTHPPTTFREVVIAKVPKALRR